MSCKSFKSGQLSNENISEYPSRRFVLPEQVTPPQNIQSLQLYPEGQPTSPPVIPLNGPKTLVLEFDHLSSHTRQFKISLSHRNQDWSKSSLAPSRYMESFFETYFGGGVPSFTQNPSYRHYKYQFPNERLQITKSGNYLLSVRDYETGRLLFRIPFFVSENKGKLQTRIQTLFVEHKDVRTAAQPFSSYQYPAFVMQPQFDLSFSYVQNQFWGRTRQVHFLFTASTGVVQFHLGRNKAFIGDYEFNVLDLRELPPDGREIIDFLPGKTPPVVILKRDVQAFSTLSTRFPEPVTGIPIHDRQAQYASVRFRLETATDISDSARMYLVGSFTNWTIDERYRMHLDMADSLWKGNALIKQGIYAYKYVLLRNGRIDDLALDRGFTDNRQYYLTFVYYRDPELHYDRLLKVGRTVAR